MGDKSASNIIKSIENSKNRPLSRLIYALGIRHIGEEMAQVLAEHFGSIDELANTSKEELMSIPTVGPKIADSIIAFFSQKENRNIIEKLRRAGVKLSKERAKPLGLPLTGQEFVITGILKAFTREEAEARVRALGGTAKDTVTRNTSYLVVGADPGGAKLTRAQALTTKQITEEEFLRLLNPATR
jgi:DNA ligase (NAD+)